ncbi:DMT family transporter [Ralstonia solanacearum]|uniref:DMT family transporter n=1 Tax=Ralstonia solanacearum TaxID=305 RepID=UPI00078D4C82|nr:DMT family transporter [Ralstonia solanacearum]AMP38170.1 multidrug DMT transporter permease [Ralstonia solanacearum]AXV86997.1 EamA/RhaT family transporter [Ralstonia solanacearum]AXW06494.1 EamA/RhaT family transporter [Ralstonia solanacearum]AXW24237.1 EamA/RhaT family transporter [Ralstonia solanacearum]AXW81172.1 EamA/RhaT family transporter [Ralstonia solanacearum]
MTQSAALPLNHTPDHAERRGLLLGFIGMAIFSQTLPFTRMAVAELDATFVALARAVLASLLALALLAATGGLRAARRPRGGQWWRLAVTAAGVVVGFPLLSSLAMRDVPATHGAIITGLLPLATAVFAAWFGRERPSPWFWACALTGSVLVVGFALLRGAGTLHRADWLLFASMVAGALGYAVGGKLSRELGGTQTIAWALMVSLPVLLPVVGALVWLPGTHQAAALAHASSHAWLGLAYVSVFSMFVGFLFWYSGLAAGGVARVGQIQLLQPFMTLIGGWLLLGEPLDAPTVLFALAVIAVVGLSRRTAVRR